MPSLDYPQGVYDEYVYRDLIFCSIGMDTGHEWQIKIVGYCAKCGHAARGCKGHRIV